MLTNIILIQKCLPQYNKHRLYVSETSVTMNKGQLLKRNTFQANNIAAIHKCLSLEVLDQDIDAEMHKKNGQRIVSCINVLSN